MRFRDWVPDFLLFHCAAVVNDHEYVPSGFPSEDVAETIVAV